MSRKAKFRVTGRLGLASRYREGTVTIYRSAGLFEVRPLRSRQTYSLELDAVAEMVVDRLIKAEVRKAKEARKKK